MLIRRFYILALFFFFACQVWAEYSEYPYEVQIVKKNGTILHGFNTAGGYIDEDSMQNTEFLLKVLNRRNPEWMYFFKERLSYRPQDLDSNFGEMEYLYFFKDSVAVSEIESIQILDWERQLYLNNIVTTHSLSDTVWMKNKPLDYVQLGGYFCDMQIMLYEDSPEIRKIIEELRAIAKVEDETEEYVDYDAAIDKLLGKKVVIVLFCSC